MEAKEVPIDTLKPSEYNPRALTEKEKKDLMESIKRFGMVEPIVVNSAENRKNIIIGGHQRFYICKELGWETIPVVYVNIPDPRKEKELNLRLNKNLGHWDWNLLANFEEDLLKDVGFSNEELDEIFELEMDEEFDVEKELEKVLETKERKCKEGDLWQLGNHRLFIGDATKKESWEKVLQGEKIDMVFTDPPYGVSYSSRSPLKKHLKIKFDDKKKLPDLLDNFYHLSYEFSNDVCSMYVFYADQKEDIDIIFKTKMRENGWFIAGNIIWIKNYLSKGWNDYRYQYEPILYGWKYGKKRYWKGGRKETNVWNYSLICEKEIRDIHLTPKPVELICRAIKNSSKRESIVMDCFGGSGPTLIACEIMKRKCRMIEIEPIYGEIIINRWGKFTGGRALKLN